jgi:hypothetical protein
MNESQELYVGFERVFYEIDRQIDAYRKRALARTNLALTITPQYPFNDHAIYILPSSIDVSLLRV